MIKAGFHGNYRAMVLRKSVGKPLNDLWGNVDIVRPNQMPLSNLAQSIHLIGRIERPYQRGYPVVCRPCTVIQIPCHGYQLLDIVTTGSNQRGNSPSP